MMTLIPAALHFSIEPGTESLGGSTSEISPIKTYLSNGKFGFFKFGLPGN